MTKAERLARQKEYDKEWQKEANRLKKRKRELELRGYKVSDDFVPEKPKVRNEKSLENLKKFRGEEVYKKTVYIDKETGKAYRGKAGREQEKRENRKATFRRRKKNREELDKRLEEAFGKNQPDTEPSQQSQQAQQEQQQESDDKDYVPDFDFIEELIEMLQIMSIPLEDIITSAPDSRMFFRPRRAIYEIRDDIDTVINSLYTKISQLRSSSNIQAIESYREYLQENLEGIQQEVMDCIYNESNHDAFVQRIYRVVTLLQNAPLTLEDYDSFDSFYDTNQSETPEEE